MPQNITDQENKKKIFEKFIEQQATKDFIKKDNSQPVKANLNKDQLINKILN